MKLDFPVTFKGLHPDQFLSETVKIGGSLLQKTAPYIPDSIPTITNSMPKLIIRLYRTATNFTNPSLAQPLGAAMLATAKSIAFPSLPSAKTDLLNGVMTQAAPAVKSTLITHAAPLVQSAIPLVKSALEALKTDPKFQVACLAVGLFAAAYFASGFDEEEGSIKWPKLGSNDGIKLRNVDVSLKTKLEKPSSCEFTTKNKTYIKVVATPGEPIALTLHAPYAEPTVYNIEIIPPYTSTNEEIEVFKLGRGQTVRVIDRR